MADRTISQLTTFVLAPRIDGSSISIDCYNMIATDCYISRQKIEIEKKLNKLVCKYGEIFEILKNMDIPISIGCFVNRVNLGIATSLKASPCANTPDAFDPHDTQQVCVSRTGRCRSASTFVVEALGKA